MNERRRHLARDLVVLVLVQVVVLLAFQAVLPASVGENESTDFTGFYLPVAERLADHGRLEVAEGQPALRYPPGYPVVLAGAFMVGDLASVPRDRAADAVGVLAAAVAGVLLHLVARRVFDRRHAWVSSAVWLAYPLTLWVAKQPNSELPYMVALYAGVLLLVPVLTEGTLPWPRALGAGALFGLAATIRPAGLILLPAAAVVVALRLGRRPSRRHLPAVGFVLLSLVPVAGATAWMSAPAGSLVVLSDANEVNLVEGMTFAVDSNAEADALAMSGTLRDWVKETHADERDLSRPGEARRHLMATARREPDVLAQLVAYKALRSWYGTESFRYEGLLAAAQVCWLGAAGAGVWCARRRGDGARWYVALVLALLGASWLAAIAALSIVRYLVPTLGLLAPLVAVAVLATFDRIRRGRAPGTAPHPAVG